MSKLSDTEVDGHRAQILRQQCQRVLSGKRVQDIVGAIEMLMADIMMNMPAQTEETAIEGVNAIAADARNIIRERFAMQKRGN